MFESIKTTMIETFEECYVVTAEASIAATTAVVAAVTPQGGDSLWYREFINTKPPNLNKAKDPISMMGWIYDVEGYFYN